MTSEVLFVWNALPGQWPPVVAGKLEIARTASGAVGTFVYGQSYLRQPRAIPLDPVSLPLSARATDFTTLHGFPGVIVDACPDRWGIKVIDRLLGKQNFPVGYLLLNDPGRAGSLAFSRSAAEPPVELASREFSLAELLDAAEAVETNREVALELLKALHPGTGGARPKCNLIDAEGVWIAKFASLADDPRVSIPRLEHAAMTLARACGIRAAETRCVRVAGRDVCLVRRFDRVLANGQVFRRGYVSARSVFYADPAFGAVGTGSYGRLATWMTRYGCAAAERSALFRRMVFNCAIRNSDDHDLNHGLVQAANGSFELAEAFDVLPVLASHRIHHHALLIGDSAAGTVENLVSNSAAFGLTRDEALAVVYEVQARVRQQWRDVCYTAGFGDEALRRLEAVFQPIPLTG